MTLLLLLPLQEELETLLDDSKHLRTLAFLYASKGMCSKALTIWRMLAKNYSTGLWKNPASSDECDSLNSCTDLSSGQQSAANEASKLLQESSDQDLVLEHLEWVCYIRDCAYLLVRLLYLKCFFVNKLFGFFLILDCRC